MHARMIIWKVHQLPQASIITESSADRQASIIAQRPPRLYARLLLGGTREWPSRRATEKDVMKKFLIPIFVGATFITSTAVAHNTQTAYTTRGACEAANASMSNDERDWLVETFPQFFDTPGEASSFLARAWTCDRNASDGQSYITDHRLEVLGSKWFQQRNH